MALLRTPVERLEADVNRLRVQVAEAEAARAAAEARKATLRSEAVKAAAEGTEGPDVSKVLGEIRAAQEAADVRLEASAAALELKEAALLEAKAAERRADLTARYQAAGERLPAAVKALGKSYLSFARDLAVLRQIEREGDSALSQFRDAGLATKNQGGALEVWGAAPLDTIFLEAGNRAFGAADIERVSLLLPVWPASAKG